MVIISPDGSVECPMSDEFLERAAAFHAWDQSLISREGLAACAFCGKTGLGCRLQATDGKANKKYQLVPAQLDPTTQEPVHPPYGICNPFLEANCFSLDHKFWWVLVCV